MPRISYVYPNVSGIPQRGGLAERWQLATDAGCDYIEIPADFIKNKTEIKKTKLGLGDVLTKDAISILYEKDQALPKDIKYILHTEPSLTRRDGYGLSHQAPLKWYEKGWVEQFTGMVISISRYFGLSASAIEIHPGDKRNRFQDILEAIVSLLSQYYKQLGTEPLILLENRTGQFISSGRDIADFWQYVKQNYPEMRDKIGVVLDVQQLYTVTKNRFLNNLELLPIESIKGLHIHYRHRAPSNSDEIPWKDVFTKVRQIEGDLLINPEIHHKNKVEDAIQFIKDGLRQDRPSQILFTGGA